MTTRPSPLACAVAGALAVLGACAALPPPPEPRRAAPAPVVVPAPAPAPVPAPPPLLVPAPAPVAAATTPPAVETPRARRKAAVRTAPASPRTDFDRVQLGMTPSQVTALLGAPTSRGPLGDRAWAPTGLGADGGDRIELRYAGTGRLEFAGGRPGAPDSARLVRVVPDNDESGRR